MVEPSSCSLTPLEMKMMTALMIELIFFAPIFCGWKRGETAVVVNSVFR